MDIRRFYSAILISLGSVMLGALPVHAAITLSKDFNTGALDQGVFSLYSLCNPPHDGSLSSDFAPDGGMSFRAETRLTDSICSSGMRSELYLGDGRPEMKTAEWFAFDTYVPAAQPDDPRPEAFAQYQTRTSVGAPLWALWYENGAYKFMQHFRSDGVTDINIPSPITGTYGKGTWHRWVVHYKRSITADGVFEVWVDGEKKVTRLGANANAALGVVEPTGYFKFGIYKWVNSGPNPSTQASRVVYLDNIRLGDSAAEHTDFISSTPVVVDTDTTPPSIVLTASKTGVISGSTTFTATTSDTSGISRVEFFQDTAGAPFTTDTTAPYTATVDTTAISDGQHTVHAISYDTKGNHAASNTISFTVQNQTPSVPVSGGGGGGGSSSGGSSGGGSTSSGGGGSTTPSSSSGGGGGSPTSSLSTSTQAATNSVGQSPTPTATVIAGCDTGNVFSSTTGARCDGTKPLVVTIATATITGRMVNVRTAPVNGAVITALPAGTIGTVLATDNGWVKAVFGKTTGWVAQTLVTLSTTSSVSSTKSTGPYDFGPVTLTTGSRGAAVMELQRFLNTYVGLGLVVDGILGAKTTAVIRTWQLQHGLEPDGLIGAKTKAIMNQIASQS